MKTGSIHKTLKMHQVTKEQLQKISTYTRRPLEKEEVYVFSLILCDNEIDREFERFSNKALGELAKLFKGKTGIFDHKAKAEHQAARIFDTQLVTTKEKNSLGIPYQYLMAHAYMVRCEKNNDLILEIDAGIKKEVSVGCAVQDIVCSVCGKEQKKSSCGHQKGKSYKGVLCHYVLEHPTDAYEWSFVAIPAQKNAGVIKKFGERLLSFDTLKALVESGEEATLSTQELARLTYDWEALHELAKAGERYMSTLQKEAVRYASISQPRLDSNVVESVTKRMSVSELIAFHKAYETAAEERLAPTLQLGSTKKAQATEEKQFKI